MGAIASRHSNPFATCWIRPGALALVTDDGVSPEGVIAHLRRRQWRGQIVGPHGAGKSTLLSAIEPLAGRAGRIWHRVNLRDGQTAAARAALHRVEFTPQTLLVIDGYEQLGPLQRATIRWRCWRSGAGLLVTTHTWLGLPTLARIQPSVRVALAVFRALTAGQPTPVTEADCINAFNACNANIREMLFHLYDLHERQTR